MNSRRRIALSGTFRDMPNRAVQLGEQSRKLGLTEWGPTVVLLRESFALRMSLKGHSRHVAQHDRSGVPPIADKLSPKFYQRYSAGWVSLPTKISMLLKSATMPA
jgi:hypothetical protein